MKKFILVVFLCALAPNAHADFWGGDLPLLAEIVTNTLNTLMELKKQSSEWNDELDGIKDKINRVQTIADVVQPSTWQKWKDPNEALQRLRLIYYTMPKEYRSDKSDVIEDELSKSMNMVSRLSPETHSAFESGKEMERRGADASPGVAQKLTASGVGTLIAMDSQSQVIESHIVSLLAQMLAEGNEREVRSVVSHGESLSGVSHYLDGENDDRFSRHALTITAAP